MDDLLDLELLELLDDLLDFELLEELEPDFESLEAEELFFEFFFVFSDPSDLDEEAELPLLAFSFLDAESALFEALTSPEAFSLSETAEADVSDLAEVSLVFEAVFSPEAQEQDAIKTAIKALTPAT